MTAPPDGYRKRRANLAAKLSRPLVICAGHAPARNYPANAYPFRAGSTYLYYGGPAVEGAALLIEPQSDGQTGCTLLRPPTGIEDAVWMGELPADSMLAAASGIPEKQFASPDDLMTILNGRNAAVVGTADLATHQWIRHNRLESASDAELMPIIDQRNNKDDHEMAAMRKAAAITVEAHRAAMTATRPGTTEADVAAAFYAVLVRHQARPSFTPNVTIRGDVLHGSSYANRLTDGSLLLLDGGAEEPGGYACDVTRTYPVNATFTGIQRKLYETVLNSQQQAIDACVPGKGFREIHDLSARVICEGLVDAGLLRGDPGELAGRRAHTLFFTHGLGHLIGIDAHDMEDFGDRAGYAPGRKRRPAFGDKYLRLDRELTPGMTLTIEPGIYLVPAIWRFDEMTKPFEDVINRKQIDALLENKFGGIRIEETICVRPPDAGGPEVLTKALPKAMDELEGIIGR